MARPVARVFQSLLRAALTTNLRSTKQVEPHVRRLRDFVNANKSAAALDEMLGAYYQDYRALEGGNDANAGRISAAAFEQLFRLRIQVATYFDPVFQEALALLVDKTTKPEATDPLWVRHQSLDSVNRSAVVAVLQRKRADKKASLTFFEILQDLYAHKHGRLPEDDAELFSFAPSNDPALVKAYGTAVAPVLQAVFRGHAHGDVLEKVLTDFATWASSSSDMARGFQILLWTRATVTQLARGKPFDLQILAWQELYLVTVQRAVMSAIAANYHRVQQSLLMEEEVDVLLQPLLNAPYFSDYADRLYIFATGAAFGAGKAFNDLGILHIRLLVFADEMNVHLLSTSEADDVADILLERGRELRRARWFLSGAQLGGASVTVRIGDHVSGVGQLTLVDAASNYVFKLDGFEHQLFLVHATRIGSLLDDHLVGELRRGTEHLLVLIPAFFQLLQYTFSFITGGFSGLLEEIVEDLVVEAAADAATAITGSEKIGMGISLIGNPTTLAMPGRRIAKGAGKAGAKAIRKVVAKYRLRKSHIPRAKVRKGGKRPSRGKAPKPKPQHAKPPSAAEQKRILRRQLEYDKLASKQVEMGAKTPGGFAKVSAHEAITRLFSDKIADLPRLAQHWPHDLATKYVTQLETMLKKKLRNNPKLAAEVAGAVAQGRLTREVLDKLSPALQKQVKDFVSDRWNSIRSAFWRRVYKDKALRAELAQMNIRFKLGRPGSAPSFVLGDKKIKLSIDHVARKVENPLQAFSADNLRVLTSRDNSVLKEGLVRQIEADYTMGLDQFSALPRQRFKLPKDVAKELGDTLDKLPLDDDLWRGTFSP